MALDSLLRKGVRIADKQTKSVQGPVNHKPWVSQTGYGTAVYDPPAGNTIYGVIDQTTHQAMLPTGKPVTVNAIITFLEPIAENATSGRTGAIDNRDKLTLPNGFSAPIINIEGPYDPGTDRPFYLQVWLGRQQQ